MQHRNICKALTFLQACSHRLTPQQYKTLRGQILAGDTEGAMKGLLRLLTDKSKKEVRP